MAIENTSSKLKKIFAVITAYYLHATLRHGNVTAHTMGRINSEVYWDFGDIL